MPYLPKDPWYNPERAEQLKEVCDRLTPEQREQLMRVLACIRQLRSKQATRNRSQHWN
jgi:hypothetical protein